MNKNRVVITGMGAMTPIGKNVPDFWDGLMKGQSGVSLIDQFDVSAYTTKIAGTIRDIDFTPYFDKKEIRRTSRFILLGVAAAIEAVKDSGLDIESIQNDVGVEVGSGIGGIEILEKMAVALEKSGPSRISPFTVPMMIPDMAAGLIAIKTGAKGPNSCSVTACASAAHSMGNAFRLIQRGEAKAMIVGGAEAAVTPLGLASFCAARSLSTRNDDPTKASRPFDKNRDGFVMGEGAGILVFEDYEHAKSRNATIYGEIVGFGSSGDAYHITAPAPEGEGATRAMTAALDDAGIQTTDIDYINAHGTSTELNDKNESMAIKEIFGDHAYKLKVSSIKSMTGHPLGAAGAIEAIACIKTFVEGKIPPTINCDETSKECDLDYVPNNAIEADVSYAMSNSFGFGGHNAVLIFKKYTC